MASVSLQSRLTLNCKLSGRTKSGSALAVKERGRFLHVEQQDGVLLRTCSYNGRIAISFSRHLIVSAQRSK